MLKVHGVMQLQGHSTWSHRVMVQPYDLLLLITAGKLVYQCNDDIYPLEKGQIVYIPKGTSRIGIHNGMAHEKWVLRFICQGVEDELSMLAGQETIVLRTGRYYEMEQLFSKLNRYWNEKDPCFETLCQAIAVEMLALANREIIFEGRSAEAGKWGYLQQTFHYIKENYRSSLSIEELAEQVKKNKSYLITAYKKKYGYTPLEHMHKIRISKGEELLQNSTLTVEAIAARLGYCDASYFYRKFKKETGLSPSAYRMQV
ncbi:AraC family transcriptional regulator [Paenibacillus sp. PL2-23]|uniref:AraC family transcriptional regulator n=1 Tax=Paenibacillus sp. PL2-23 TaxID=2100729 RepID=UPI0030F8A0EE